MEMTQTANTNTQTSPRFLVAGKELIYKLFDAFLKKTVIEDKAIDFSKPVVPNEDGTVEFTGSNQSFTALMCGMPLVQFNLKEKPEQLRGESDKAYQKRLAQFEKENHYTENARNYQDYVSACKVYKEAAYAFLGQSLSEEPEMLNFLREPKEPVVRTATKEPKEVPVPQKKKNETDEHFADRMTAYQRKVDAREETIRARQEKREEKMNAYRKKLADVREENQKREKHNEDAKKEYREKLENLLKDNRNIFMIACHLHWLWSLGAKDVATGCGFYGELAEIKNPGSSTDGVWGVPTKGDLKKNLLLIYAVFERFLSWPKRPSFNNVDEVKKSLIDFVFKTRKDIDAPIRNGLLHFCNPDKYINFYTFREKVAYVEHHKTLLSDYIDSGEAKYNGEDSLFYSLKGVTDGEFEGDYRANRTEEKVCHIYDKLHAPAAV